MHYASENHIYDRDTPPPRRSSLVPVATRDDLIRLVVGMQWAQLEYAIVNARFFGTIKDDGGVDPSVVPDFMLETLNSIITEKHRPAVDIVDEWLGVR